MSSEALKRKAIHICGNVHGSPLQPAVFRIVRTQSEGMDAPTSQWV